jgi:threonine dehydrogenase-like Zn-dependent dehydrogenase
MASSRSSASSTSSRPPRRIRSHRGYRRGRPAPVRAYNEELLPDVLDGRIEPGRAFDRSARLDEVPDGYRAMNERDVLKFQIGF